MKPKRLLAVGVFLASVTAASVTGAQKPSAPQPTEQQKLKERVDALDSQLKEAQAKADRAAIEKDYMTRIQKQYETYYEKAFNTQVTIVSIIALFITIVFGLAAKFGFGVFDRSIQHALSDASASLRTEFTQMLNKETQAIRQANAAQLKTLEDGLTERISVQEEDLKTRSDYQFQFVQGVALAAAREYGDARECFRLALKRYKSGKPKQLIPKEGGVIAVRNVFVSLSNEDEANHVENARNELADELYNNLEDELALAATNLLWLGPLLKERK